MYKLSTEALLEKAITTPELTHEELVHLLSLPDEQIPQLMAAADTVRQNTVGNAVHLRGIIEFSSYCKQHCAYCGLRADNREIERYRLSPEIILETAKAAVDTGYHTLVLQCGEDMKIAPETIAELTTEIKQMGAAVTLSCGERSYEVYQLWREAGADRYLIKHETADPALYKSIRPGHTLYERLQCQHWLKELGYQLGSGCMIGLPGQTVDILARDLELMKEMEVEMCGMGPFIPHAQTPLHFGNTGSISMTLKMMATARIYMPWMMLPATTALVSLHPEGRELALRAGANVIMPNVSPETTRSLYQIYPGKLNHRDSMTDYYNKIT
ncbi:MAG: [FeFe] hydrogenase H-cluster radical SAM maturase HydE, partial [Peptococcaceae bacterium]|nr:[FeFe] hydrogenase H-cluster radical SAM maturase HydE [Peptococcaceae bacterium]